MQPLTNSATSCCTSARVRRLDPETFCSPLIQLRKHRHCSSNRCVAQTLTIEQQIRQRAYELYEQRGRTDGHDLDDWFQAESEIKSTQANAATA